MTPDEIEEEKLRRQEIAAIRMDLYGERTGAYGSDPLWDDVIPMPVEDGEGALAAIAYPEDYAEGDFFFFPILFFFFFLFFSSYHHGVLCYASSRAFG